MRRSQGRPRRSGPSPSTRETASLMAINERRLALMTMFHRRSAGPAWRGSSLNRLLRRDDPRRTASALLVDAFRDHHQSEGSAASAAPLFGAVLFALAGDHADGLHVRKTWAPAVSFAFIIVRDPGPAAGPLRVIPRRKVDRVWTGWFSGHEILIQNTMVYFLLALSIQVPMRMGVFFPRRSRVLRDRRLRDRRPAAPRRHRGSGRAVDLSGRRGGWSGASWRCWSAGSRACTWG